jgi:ketosteroid isomerase-like protein
MSVRDVAARYFACVDAHDADGLSRLFAEDGWLRPPPPIKKEMQGRDAIREFYAELFRTNPTLRIDPDFQLIADGDVCAARFSSWTHGRHVHGVIDIFTVNDRDELVEMIAYSRQQTDDR